MRAIKDGRPRAARRGVLLTSAALLMVAVTGCTAGSKGTPSSALPSGAASGATPSDSPSAAPVPVVKLVGSAKDVSYRKAIQLTVANGSFTSVQVNVKGDPDGLDGTVSGDGLHWFSQNPPKPDLSYQAVARVTDAAGQVQVKKVNFSVAKVPDDQRVGFNVTPGDNSVVGIGQPIVVRFLVPITNRAAIERVLDVEATTPTGHAVSGSWSWLNSQEVHWRPRSFWTPGTTVKLDMRIAGVKAASNRYGRKDYTQTFKIGASHVTQVNATTHRVKIYRDGKLMDTWPTGTGRRGLETYSGTYIVLGKAEVVQMDSCSARVTCDKKNRDYYNEKEYWATRITASGTFLHAAGWDHQLGVANVSHGCIHLSDADAKIFYNHAVVGDVVIVKNTGRGPEQRIATQDPGLYDWNVSQKVWNANSALH